MAASKLGNLQDFLITTATFALTIISLTAIFGARSDFRTQAIVKPLLSVQHYHDPSEQVPAKVLAAQAEPTQPVVDSPAPTQQPALESWLGPIDPLPPDTIASLPVLSKIPTAEPVIFLTIDDGWVQTPEALAWLSDHRLPITMFLTDNGIKNNYNYFIQLQAAGMPVEDHTISHPHMTALSLDAQKAEICSSADTYASVFGIRPTLFRPPYGQANQLTFQAAHDCGMKAVVMWRAYVEKGVVYYQDNLTHFEPGDIVLMHFTHDFLSDIQTFIKQADADHLQVARLEDWLP